MDGDEVDVYRIARLLINEHGVFAEDKVKEKIKFFTEQGDSGAAKVWYEVDDALKEIIEASVSVEENEPA